jgi:hypothetical protein
MTRERDIERVLDAWLGEGATAMPDRVYLAVLDRVDRQPQRRLARLKLRFSEMRPAIRIAAVAAVLLLTFGVGAAVVGGAFDTDAPAPTAEPSPALSPSPSPSPAAELPAELAHIWIGGERPLTALGITLPALVVLDLDPDVGTSSYAELNVNLESPIFASRPSLPAVGQLRFETAIGDAGCTTGDVGTYEYSLSPDGMILSLQAVEDACSNRADAFTGDWTRSQCKNPDDYCLGEVPAGSYVSTFLDVRTAAGDGGRNRGAYGQLRYTVSDGWANSDDWPSQYRLIPSSAYALDDGGGLETWHGIHVLARPEAMFQDEGCTNGPAAGVGRTLGDLTAWVSGHPGLDATVPEDITIGGHPATMVDIAVAADWTQTCPDVPGGAPVVDLFREARDGDPQWNWGIGTTERQRVILVELAPDNVLLIAIDDASSPSRSDELVAAAMPIVDSFEFPE